MWGWLLRNFHRAISQCTHYKEKFTTGLYERRTYHHYQLVTLTIWIKISNMSSKYFKGICYWHNLVLQNHLVLIACFTSQVGADLKVPVYGPHTLAKRLTLASYMQHWNFHCNWPVQTLRMFLTSCTWLLRQSKGTQRLQNSCTFILHVATRVRITDYEIKGSMDISTQIKLRQVTHPDDIADPHISFCDEPPARAWLFWETELHYRQSIEAGTIHLVFEL